MHWQVLQLRAPLEHQSNMILSCLRGALLGPHYAERRQPIRQQAETGIIIPDWKECSFFQAKNSETLFGILVRKSEQNAT